MTHETPLKNHSPVNDPIVADRLVRQRRTSEIWTGPNLGYDHGGRLMAAWLDR